MNTWTIADPRGNVVTVSADTLADALDIAYDDDGNRATLYGNAEHWDIRSDTGERYPRQSSDMSTLYGDDA